MPVGYLASSEKMQIMLKLRNSELHLPTIQWIFCIKNIKFKISWSLVSGMGKFALEHV